MPIYEYECNACGHRMETLQRMSDDPLKECPQCHAEALRKLVSAASFKLKGQGWYESDFKKPVNPTGASAQEGDKHGDKQDGKTQSTDKAVGESSTSEASKGGSDASASSTSSTSASTTTKDT